jgi:hypothetical protein
MAVSASREAHAEPEKTLVQGQVAHASASVLLSPDASVSVRGVSRQLTNAAVYWLGMTLRRVRTGNCSHVANGSTAICSTQAGRSRGFGLDHFAAQRNTSGKPCNADPGRADDPPLDRHGVCRACTCMCSDWRILGTRGHQGAMTAFAPLLAGPDWGEPEGGHRKGQAAGQCLLL